MTLRSNLVTMKFKPTVNGDYLVTVHDDENKPKFHMTIPFGAIHDITYRMAHDLPFDIQSEITVPQEAV